ncbi:Hypothetical protein Tpal_384 [Trichococcus palustris]|jgi:sugar phosphate isomerase/epimerase|uniref:Xylose isomerase-like TIM barrel domain-containing protein n=1 Tax=Trichococcus palustris TaxID=140314 RepID=A0A143Y912_9LACT|nr:sugar phosphate isomerase/epimerase [Trichococcus palustris]CZQ83005.1 Hypothetical protein Tpal_384 [Trichococcus palustris]SFK68719.1 Sugar phosphate isomerase/epimerase [Trichococcus palustris]
MSRLMGLNTLAYMNKQADGKVDQKTLLKEISELGFTIVEIRREYLTEMDTDIDAIAQQAKRLQLDVFYSVPSELFIKGALNDHLAKYFSETVALGGRQLKLTLGEFEQLTPEIASALEKLLKEYPVHLTIENDQSVQKGGPEALINFIEQVKEKQLDIGLTFDTGNFVYIGVDPEEAAYKLKDFVSYIHIKNVKVTDDGVVLSGLKTGDINMKTVLNVFPDNIPAAVEYPCGSGEEILSNIAKDFEEIRSWQ